jgi:uncharacterized protein YhaN
MRLERLTLERYGAFSDRSLDFRSDAALHIVVGPNESGKTSALSAIGDLLFGFDHITPYDFAHGTKTLRIGGVFRLADGSALAFRRRKGTKNTLIDADDQPLSDDLLGPLLGPLDKTMFRREFGLTTAELRDGGKRLLEAGGRLAETLAASSAGLTTLSRLRDSLSAEADALFAPRKSAARAFYVALDRHDAAERRLRDSIVTADAFKAADLAVDEALEKHASLKAGHEQAGRDLARLQRAIRTRPKLARLNDLAAALEPFAALAPIAVSTTAHWRSALAADKQLADQIAQSVALEAADAAAIATMAVDEPLLAEADAIDALRERLGAVRKAIDDLPRRVGAMTAAHDALTDAARRLGLGSHDALLARLPTDPALARARELIAAGRRATEKRRDAATSHEAAVRQRDQLAAEQAAAPEPADPEPMRRRLDALSDLPADADRLRRETAACDAESAALVEIAATLDPAVGGPDALATLRLPEPEAIAVQLRAAESLAADIRELRARRVVIDRAIEISQAAIARLSRDGAQVTSADLFTARAHRETDLDMLEAALDAASEERRSRLAVVRARVREVDEIADSLLTDTERAGRRQAADETLAERREESRRADSERAALERRRDSDQAAWRQIWEASGIVPREPAEMAIWRDRAAAVLDRRDRLRARHIEIEVLSERVVAARAALLPVLEGDGGADADRPAELLYREARNRLEALQKAWGEAAARQLLRKRAEQDVAAAAAALSESDGALARWARDWPDAAMKIGVQATASIEEAEAALGVWQSVPLPRQTFEREKRSVTGIETDLALFDAGVAAIVAKAAPALAGLESQAALARLVAMLAEARRAADARARLQKAMVERQGARMALERRRGAANASFADAFRSLGVDRLEALEAALDRLERREALARERDEVLRDLVAIGDGLDEAALRAEQSEIDIDLAPGAIERLALRQGQLLAEIGEASTLAYQAGRDRELLVRGRDAVGAARERAEAAADLLSIAERWIIRAAAARLATRAIERHRAAAQDPLVARAGALFSVATAHAFSGLGADYDEEDRPVLVARRANGGFVTIDGLSEGTRDQLFLALRLALLERRAAEPLPFIGDDLLASFDEARTSRTLALLSEFGGKRQVILFTHHRHVAVLAAESADPSIDVVWL